MYILKNIFPCSRLRIREDSSMIQENDSEKRIFHMESNSPGWSLKEGKRDSLREKRRFIIRHVCTLRQSLPTGLVKKYTLDQWGRDTLLILPLVTFLSLLVIIGDMKHTCMKNFSFDSSLKSCFFVYLILFTIFRLLAISKISIEVIFYHTKIKNLNSRE